MDRHHPHDLVVWIDGAKAPTEECQVVFDVVVGRKLTRFEAVAEAVATELFTRDCLRAGGDAAAMERLRTWYVVAARRLLQAQNGISIRITPAPTSSVSPHLDHLGVTPGAWRRPVGLYAALGGFLAAFQHVVQRYLFQGRPVDVGSGLILAAYVGVGVLGLRWFLDPHDAHSTSVDGRPADTGH
jgi:hypothetical protein